MKHEIDKKNMKNTFFKEISILIVFNILLSLLMINNAVAENSTKVALIIGNSNYTYSSLLNPANDARDISQVLKKLGFVVTLIEDVDQNQMKAAIDKFGSQISDAEVALFYYAGHGLQYEGWNYLVPLKADIRDESDIQYESVDMNNILQVMGRMSGGVKIIILDACRNNPYARFDSGKSGLAKMDAPKGTFIGYSTSPGAVAFDGAGRNSPYTASLLKHLATKNLSIEELFKRVRNDVGGLTAKRQVPWESTSLVQDFSFNSQGEDIGYVALSRDEGTSWLRRNLVMGRFVSIGTGGIRGLYYPMGGGITKIVNKQKNINGFQCVVEPTRGSTDNIERVLSGEKDMGIVSSLQLYLAYNNIGRWKRQKGSDNLRSIFSLYPESITVVVDTSSGFNSVADLKGKKVYIGNKGGYNRSLVDNVLEGYGLKTQKKYMFTAVDGSLQQGVALLKSGEVDAWIAAVAHPSGFVRDLAETGKDKFKILPVSGRAELVESKPFLAAGEIAVTLYPGLKNIKSVKTVGPRAMMVTTEDIEDDIVYALTKQIFENLPDFKALHPMFLLENKQSMLKGMPVPMHPGAINYYKEVGLIE